MLMRSTSLLICCAVHISLGPRRMSGPQSSPTGLDVAFPPPPPGLANLTAIHIPSSTSPLPSFHPAAPAARLMGGSQTADADNQRDALLDPRCTRSLPLVVRPVFPLLPFSALDLRYARTSPLPTECAAGRSRGELRRPRDLRVSFSVCSSPADPD